MPDSERRLKVQSCLHDAGVGCWLAWRPDELVLLLGYLPHWGLSVCVYPATGTPVLFIPSLEPSDILPPAIDVIEYGWGLMNCDSPFGDLYELIRKHLRKEGLDAFPITYVRSGAGSSPTRSPAELPPFDPQALDLFKNLSGAGVLPIEDQLLGLYTVKTAIEIERIRLANRIADHGLSVFYENLRKGYREAQIAGDVERAVQGRIGDDGVHYARAWAFIQSGPHTADAGRFNRSTGRQLASGDLVTIELATCVNGYWSDLTRTGCVGEPSEAVRRLWSVVAEAQIVARDLVRPGSRASDIDHGARSVIEKAGFGDMFPHATGHQTGLRYHDPGPTLRPGSEESLTEGMVVTIEPGVYDTELSIGCRIEDNVCVTADAIDILSNSARGLHGEDV